MGTFWRGILKGSLGPVDNDSRYLLDVHSRDLPGEKTMRRYPDSDEVDLVIVGATPPRPGTTPTRTDQHRRAPHAAGRFAADPGRGHHGDH
ncbi:MAG: hypothetical protein ACRDRD_15490 [Pseudonocardiaceae bacterium]